MVLFPIHTCESATGAHVSPAFCNPPPTILPTPSHPSRLSQSTRFELPNSHCQFPLGMYMFHCCSFNAFIPPSPFPIVSTSLYRFISIAAQGSVYTSMPLSQFIPCSPSGSVLHVHSLPLRLYSCPANRFISTLLLDLICVHF